MNPNAKNRDPFIGVTLGMSGYFAVLFTWNDEMDGFEPYNTGIGRYHDKAGALAEGRAWAADEGLEFIG